MPQPVEKTHPAEFIYRALPAVFHHSPDSFLQFLTRDGNKFLTFYWMEAGKGFTGFDRASFYGLDHEIRIPDPQTIIALITLPKPKAPGECYYAAFIYRPNRRLLLVIDTTKVLTLESATGDPAADTPRLVEVDKKLDRQPLGEEFANRDGFYLRVLEELR